MVVARVCVWVGFAVPAFFLLAFADVFYVDFDAAVLAVVFFTAGFAATALVVADFFDVDFDVVARVANVVFALVLDTAFAALVLPVVDFFAGVFFSVVFPAGAFFVGVFFTVVFPAGAFFAGVFFTPVLAALAVFMSSQAFAPFMRDSISDEY